MDFQGCLRGIEQRHGFIREADLPVLLQYGGRNFPGLVLVRCGSVRFFCTLDNLARMIELVEQGGDAMRDHVRDVCIPATVTRGAWEAAGYRGP